MVARVVLGVLALLTVLGGVTLTDIGSRNSLVAAVAVGFYAGGLVRSSNPAIRVLAAVAGGFAGFGVTSSLALLVGSVAGRSDPRGDLETAVTGAVWVVAGLFLVWVVVRGRWPVSATPE